VRALIENGILTSCRSGPGILRAVIALAIPGLIALTSSALADASETSNSGGRYGSRLARSVLPSMKLSRGAEPRRAVPPD
jgi:hypothetical protein